MKFTVIKPITTPTSHFPAGAEITEADLDGPMTLADWQRIGHLPAPGRAARAAVVAPDVAPATASA